MIKIDEFLLLFPVDWLNCLILVVASLWDVYKFIIKKIIHLPKHVVEEQFWTEFLQLHVLWETVLLRMCSCWLCYVLVLCIVLFLMADLT